MLATLLSAKISAAIAVAAARELFGAGCRSPAALVRVPLSRRLAAEVTAGPGGWHPAGACQTRDKPGGPPPVVVTPPSPGMPASRFAGILDRLLGSGRA